MVTPISISTFSAAYTQNFNTLSNTAGSTTNKLTIPGWSMLEGDGGARDDDQYAVDTGSSTTGRPGTILGVWRRSLTARPAAAANAPSPSYVRYMGEECAAVSEAI